jgi:hypothetical protein
LLTPSARCNSASQPGRAPRHSIATLTPTMGRQNHATSPSATPPLVPHAATAHDLRRPAITLRTRQRRVHHSPPRVRDDRDTPLAVGRDGKRDSIYSEKRNNNIFRARAGQDFDTERDLPVGQHAIWESQGRCRRVGKSQRTARMRGSMACPPSFSEAQWWARREMRLSPPYPLDIQRRLMDTSGRWPSA